MARYEKRIEMMEDIVDRIIGKRTVEMEYDQDKDGKITPKGIFERFYNDDGELIKESPSTFNEFVKYTQQKQAEAQSGH